MPIDYGWHDDPTARAEMAHVGRRHSSSVARNDLFSPIYTGKTVNLRNRFLALLTLHFRLFAHADVSARR